MKLFTLLINTSTILGYSWYHITKDSRVKFTPWSPVNMFIVLISTLYFLTFPSKTDAAFNKLFKMGDLNNVAVYLAIGWRFLRVSGCILGLATNFLNL